MAIVFAGRVTGAHFNLGVTVAVFLVEWKNWRKNLPIAGTIILADFAGGYFGCFLTG